MDLILMILVAVAVIYFLQYSGNLETIGTGMTIQAVISGDTSFNVDHIESDVTPATSVLIGTEKIDNVTVTESQVWGRGNVTVQGSVTKDHSSSEPVLFYK